MLESFDDLCNTIRILLLYSNYQIIYLEPYEIFKILLMQKLSTGSSPLDELPDI